MHVYNSDSITLHRVDIIDVSCCIRQLRSTKHMSVCGRAVEFASLESEGTLVRFSVEIHVGLSFFFIPVPNISKQIEAHTN